MFIVFRRSTYKKKSEYPKWEIIVYNYFDYQIVLRMLSFTDNCLDNLVIMILLHDVEHISGHW